MGRRRPLLNLEGLVPSVFCAAVPAAPRSWMRCLRTGAPWSRGWPWTLMRRWSLCLVGSPPPHKAVQEFTKSYIPFGWISCHQVFPATSHVDEPLEGSHTCYVPCMLRLPTTTHVVMGFPSSQVFRDCPGGGMHPPTLPPPIGSNFDFVENSWPVRIISEMVSCVQVRTPTICAIVEMGRVCKLKLVYLWSCTGIGLRKWTNSVSGSFVLEQFHKCVIHDLKVSALHQFWKSLSARSFCQI